MDGIWHRTWLTAGVGRQSEEAGGKKKKKGKGEPDSIESSKGALTDRGLLAKLLRQTRQGQVSVDGEL